MATIKSELDYIQEARSQLAEALITKFGVRRYDNAKDNPTLKGLWTVKEDGSADKLKRLHDWALLVTGTNVHTDASLTFKSDGKGDAAGTTFNGSVARSISYNSIGAAASNHVHKNLIIKWGAGNTEGTNLFTYNGSTEKTINLSAPFSLLFTSFGNVDTGFKATNITATISGVTKSFSVNWAIYAGRSQTADKWTTARTLTIGNTGKSVDGSANVSWSLAEIGVSAAAHTHSVKINGATKTIAASSGAAVDLGNYLPLSGGTMSGNIIINTDSEIRWNRNTDYSRIHFKNESDSDTDSYMGFETGDNGNEYFKFAGNNGGTVTLWMSIKADGVRASAFIGNLKGNASTATKLESSAGNAALPIYFSDGKPVACVPSSLFSTLSNSGNNLSITIAGLNRTLTVNYANSSDKSNYLTSRYIGSDGDTVAQVKLKILDSYTSLSGKQGYSILVNYSFIGKYSLNDYVIPANGIYSLTYLTPGYNGLSYGQWLAASFGILRLYVFGRYNNLWTERKTIAWTSDIPTSLKNPLALTISLNGTSLGAYDGSAAKNINITPSSIGAASSSHTHSYANIGFVTFTPANGELTPAQVLALTGGWSIKKGGWSYAQNGYIVAGSFGNIDLAGTSVLTFGDSNAYTQLYITAPAQSGHSGKTNEIFFYNNHGSNYSPGWTRVITNRNYTDYLGYIGTTAVLKSSAALALTGITTATMSGLTTTNTLKITDTSAVAHIAFSRGSYNYISAPASGSIGFCVNGNTIGSANCEMIISDGNIFPGTTNVTSLGDSSHRWSHIFSIIGDFTSYVKTSSYITFGDHGYYLTSDIRNSWRTSIYGNNASGSRLRTVRTEVTIDNFSEIYGSGLAWATGDTQGYLSVSYSSGKAWIGGGNKDTLNWSTYLVTGNNIGSQSVNLANCLKYTGLGTSVFTVAQTSNDFCGRSGWATYLIGNHGNGSTYYHQIIAMPFDKMPQYQILENGTLRSWYTFAMMGYANSGDLYAAHFYENSDIRQKTDFSTLTISTKELSTVPLFDFSWKENLSSRNTGTSAQAVQSILPNLVTESGDYLKLDYGVLGTIAGITACKELVKLKSEIDLLKERIELLELQLKMINDYGRC